MASKKKPDKSCEYRLRIARDLHCPDSPRSSAICGEGCQHWSFLEKLAYRTQIELYERKGLDRTAYGDKLMVALSERVAARGWTRCDHRELYRYRQFYITYPKIVETLSPESQNPPVALLPRKPRPAQYLCRLLQKA